MPKRAHFLYTPEGFAYLTREYSEKERSTYDIGAEQGCTHTLVNRALRYHGIARRDKAAAQSVAIKQGRTQHPTKGKHHSEETKFKIGKSIHEKYVANPQYIINLRKSGKAIWEKMTPQEREAFTKMGQEALRESAAYGSKFEKYLLTALTVAGFKVVPQASRFIANETMRVDLLLPVELIAIEIDGPAHFLPIYGEEALQKRIESDRLKNQLLLSEGYIVIRVINVNKEMFPATMRTAGETLIGLIKDLQGQQLPPEERYYEVEIGNKDSWRGKI